MLRECSCGVEVSGRGEAQAGWRQVEPDLWQRVLRQKLMVDGNKGKNEQMEPGRGEEGEGNRGWWVMGGS